MEFYESSDEATSSSFTLEANGYHRVDY